MERTLSRVRVSVGQPKDVVVETVLLVPHPSVPGRFIARAIHRKCSTNFAAMSS